MVGPLRRAAADALRALDAHTGKQPARERRVPVERPKEPVEALPEPVESVKDPED
jgi:hypothetical protein